MIVQVTGIINRENQKPILFDFRKQASAVNSSLIIFCHGLKGFKDWGHFNLIANQLADNGFLVLKFNFSHNGGTMEQPIDFPDLEAFGNNNYAQEQADLTSVIDYCYNQSFSALTEVWNNEVFLIGHSRGGGAVTINAGAEKRIHKVVSWAGISDLIGRLPSDEKIIEWKEKGVYFMPNGRTKQEMPVYIQAYDSLMANQNVLNIQSNCSRIKVPHLIIHGTEDEAVNVKEAHSLHQWNPNSELFLIQGAGHTFGGKHPYDESELPNHSKVMVEKTIQFLKK